MQADYARNYRNLWQRHWWWRAREAYLLERLKGLHRRAGSPRWRLLDVGCGDGLFFERLQRFGTVEGLEPDGSLVTDPRWSGRITVAALDDPGFDPGPTYDVVLMLDVLEHIGDDLGALRAVRAALKPDGAAILTVPALPWLWSRHDEVNEHHRRYTRRWLGRLLRVAGFEVETLRYFFAWTVPPLLLRRWLAPARGKGLAADYAVAVPPAPLNRALGALSRVEQGVGRVVTWPVGSSLLAVARPRRGEGQP